MRIEGAQFLSQKMQFVLHNQSWHRIVPRFFGYVVNDGTLAPFPNRTLALPAKREPTMIRTAIPRTVRKLCKFSEERETGQLVYSTDDDRGHVPIDFLV